MDSGIKDRNIRRVDCTFRVMDAMEDIRDIWRDTAPLQDLDAGQTEAVGRFITKARKALDQLEGLI